MSVSALDALPRTVRLIEEGLARDLHRGFQLFVWHDGRTIADCAFGESRPGVPMSSETITLWLSSGKPITAVAIAQLAQQGRLAFDDRVSVHLPEFAQQGKDVVTIRHLLTHTGGFRNVETGWPEVRWDETIARICAAPLEADWEPGQKAGYHVASSWFVLGEVIRRLDGRSFPDYVRQQIFEPLCMHDTWNGMPAEIYRNNAERIGWMYGRGQSRPVAPRQESAPTPPTDLAQSDRTTLQPLDWQTERRVTSPSPGGNTRGPIHDLGRFYRMLLSGGALEGVRILSPQMVEQLTGRRREGMYDETFRHRLDFGLGFIVDSNRYGTETVPYGFSRYCSTETFGHGGAQSSIGFADPGRQLVVCWAANGMIGEPQHHRRNRAVNAAIYEDLGVVSGP